MGKKCQLVAERCVRILLLIGLFSASLAGAETRGLDPKRTVHEVTVAVAERLSESAARLEADPDYIKVIVRDLIVPHVDFRSIAAASIGTSWKQLSNGEQRCMTTGIRERLVERYARVLLDYDYTSIMTESVGASNPVGPIFVRQRVMTPHPEPMPVEYKMEIIGGDWKVVDLIVAGVSLVESYKASFAEQIRAEGIGDFMRLFPACRNR